MITTKKMHWYKIKFKIFDINICLSERKKLPEQVSA